MQALGLVETKGLIGAIESADIMLKTAEVSLWSKELVGGGLGNGHDCRRCGGCEDSGRGRC